MIERKFGRILIISSVAAFTGGVVGAHYAEQAGLHGLMHHLAPAWQPTGDGQQPGAPLVGETRCSPRTGDRHTSDPHPGGRIGRPMRWRTWQSPCCARLSDRQGDNSRRGILPADRRGDPPHGRPPDDNVLVETMFQLVSDAVAPCGHLDSHREH